MKLLALRHNASADFALAQLDARLPSNDPVVTLIAWIDELRREAPEFLEGGSEVYAVGGRAFTRFAGKGAAWAASLALAVRPQLFGLGEAPFALAGLAPRGLFREGFEEDRPALLGASLAAAAEDLSSDLARLHAAEQRTTRELDHLYASSSARAASRLVQALGPLTRSELARALNKTRRTASQAVAALVTAGLVASPGPWDPIRIC